MLALYNTIELILECVIVYHISSSIMWGTGEKLSIIHIVLRMINEINFEIRQWPWNNVGTLLLFSELF